MESLFTLPANDALCEDLLTQHVDQASTIVLQPINKNRIWFFFVDRIWVRIYHNLEHAVTEEGFI